MKYIYIGVSIVLQTQLRSGLYNSFLTRTPGSEGVRNIFHTISYNFSLHLLSSIIINGKYGDSPGLYTSVLQ